MHARRQSSIDADLLAAHNGKNKLNGCRLQRTIVKDLLLLGLRILVKTHSTDLAFSEKRSLEVP
jgi:hypothetical protein